METLARLIGWKLSLHGVPVQGQVTLTSPAVGRATATRPGAPVSFERISGHRDAARPPARASSSTRSCPRCVPAPPASPPRVRDHGQGRQPEGRQADERLRRPALRRRLLAGRRRARGRVHGRGLGLDPGHHDRVRARRPRGRRASAARLRPGPRGVRRRRAPAPGSNRPRWRVKVVPSMSLTSDKRRAKAGAAFEVSGTLAPAPGARAMPAGAPGRQPLGDRAAQAHQRARRPLPDQGAAEAGRVCTGSASSPTASSGAGRCAHCTEVFAGCFRTTGEHDPLLSWLPRGRALPPEVWAVRHRGLLLVLLGHLVLLPAFAVSQGWSLAGAGRSTSSRPSSARSPAGRGSRAAGARRCARWRCCRARR